MVTELILVRHGEIDANVDRLWHGTTDTELNAKGRAQVTALRESVHRKYPDITKVYSSPLKRTMKTAEAVAGGLNQSPEAFDALIEYGIGEFEGTSYEDLEKIHDFFTHIAADQNYALAGGESVNGVNQRIRTGVQSIIAAHPGERVALVGHGAAFAILIAGLLTGKPFPFFEHHLSNTGIAHLKVTDSVEILSFDDTDHLANLSLVDP